ncbi:transglutaminaseTgpA domain-containing protein [Propionibacteriaceae bacterium Y1923]|uniref:transglutaminase family protein n=1 Tax=Aestuariimicrobium sp. Y1814 TaxID=3418742 RepID=UPI003C2A2308
MSEEPQETVRRSRRMRRQDAPAGAAQNAQPQNAQGPQTRGGPRRGMPAGAPAQGHAPGLTGSEAATTRRARLGAPDPAAVAMTPTPRKRRLRLERQVDNRTPFTRLRGRSAALWLALDASAVLVLLALLVIGFEPTYGTAWLWVTVLGGGVLGMLLGWLSWKFRLGPGAVSLGAVAGWFLFGGILAMPSTLQFGVVPTLRTLRGLVTGPVTAWKGMLTLEPPIGETWNLLTVPLLLAVLVGLGAMLISLRSHRPALAWLPGAAAFGAAWALGTQVTRWPVWVAIATVAVILLWTSQRRRVLRETLVRQRRRMHPITLLIGAVVLGLVAAGTWLVAPRLQSEQARFTARSLVASPLDLQRYPSPLQTFRGSHSLHDADVMFTVSGLPEGAVVRLATMDTYNGLTYNVTNSNSPVPGPAFTRIGARVAPLYEGSEAEVVVTINQQTGVWLPTVGQTTSVVFGGPRAVLLADTFYYNRGSGTALTTSGLQPGDQYSMKVVIPQQPSEEQIRAANAGNYELSEAEGIPDLLREQALGWTEGATTKGEAALQLVTMLRTGYYSNGQDEQTPSLSGHSSDRLRTLLVNPLEMVGDEEQYAVTMALMARSLSIPARVVHGYQVPEGGSGEVRGRDVRAWPELFLSGLGWVRFDPTPDHDRVLTTKEDPSPPRPRPHVDNPPPPPKRPEKLPNDNNLPANTGERPITPPSIDWRRVGTWAAITLVPLLTLVGPVVLILGLKARRRSHRKNAPEVANRVAGAWSELVDKARDLGQSPTPTATRSEQAESMVLSFPAMITQADPINLAKRADTMVFSPEQVVDEQAAAYWTTMKEAEKGVRKSVGWRRWATSRLSVRSFRRYR